MNDGQLIDMVHSYPHLYDKARSDFKDDRKKENSWREIAEILKYSAADCKTRWKYLREKYCRIRNLMNKPSGSGAEGAPHWEYWTSLSWLEPHIQKRKTKTNLFEEPNDLQTQDFSQTQLNVDIDDNSQVNLNSPISNYSQIGGSPEPDNLSEDTVISATPSHQTRKRKCPENEEMASSFKDIGKSMKSVVEIFKEKHDSQHNSFREDEDVLFGKSVTLFLKRQTNLRKRKEFKKKVFSDMMDFSDTD